MDFNYVNFKCRFFSLFCILMFLNFSEVMSTTVTYNVESVELIDNSYEDDQERIEIFDDPEIDDLPKPDFTPPSLPIQYLQQCGVFLLCTYLDAHKYLNNISAQTVRTLKLRCYNL